MFVVLEISLRKVVHIIIFPCLSLWISDSYITYNYWFLVWLFGLESQEIGLYVDSLI